MSYISKEEIALKSKILYSDICYDYNLLVIFKINKKF